MRTFFDIVLGILFTVLKACLHALASAGGLLLLCAAVVLAVLYAFRRRAAHKRGSAEMAEVASIER